MLENLAHLHKLCFPEKPWAESDFLELKKSGCEIISSENGFIIWRAVCDEAELITIGVRPDMRKTGIAAAMLGIMENELKKLGIKNIFLEVAENNTPARRLYESCGYLQIGIRPNYYGAISAVQMKKIL